MRRFRRLIVVPNAPCGVEGRGFNMDAFLNDLMLYLLGVFILILPALLVVQLFNRS
jgi:hypothetical protein